MFDDAGSFLEVFGLIVIPLDLVGIARRMANAALLMAVGIFPPKGSSAGPAPTDLVLGYCVGLVVGYGTALVVGYSTALVVRFKRIGFNDEVRIVGWPVIVDADRQPLTR